MTEADYCAVDRLCSGTGRNGRTVDAEACWVGCKGVSAYSEDRLGGNENLEEPTTSVPEGSRQTEVLEMVTALTPGSILEPAMIISVGFGTTLWPAIVNVSGAGGGLLIKPSWSMIALS